MEITTSANNDHFNYIAFFDLDRTITKAISGRAIVQRAIRRGLMSWTDFAKAIYLGVSYRLGVADPVKIVTKMTAWVKGLSEKALADLCSEVVKEVMLPSIYHEVFHELKMHRSKNAKTVILSSSLVPICKEIADYLHMDDFICSRLEIRGGYFTGRPEGNLCFGEEKLLRLKGYCESNNSKVNESWYYGDSISDLPALKIVGVPVCVNPDRKLHKAAKENGWRICLWK